MTEDAAFVLGIAATPRDTAVALVYADWLEERGDPRAELLRFWYDLSAIPYGEETFGRLQILAAR
jgi:uncharacterized protein (TIGR02996 family)